MSILQIKKFLLTVKKALKGEHHDYTSGNIDEAVILLAVPMILELSLESVFAVVDMFFVSKLGATAIATVGLTESVVTIIYAIGIGISTGATAVVARRIGEKNPAGAAHASGQALIMATIASLLIGVLGVIFASDILRLMGASSEVVQEGTSFAQIMLGGSAAIILLFLNNGICRGAGDAAMAMKSLWVASGLNIIFCPIFIHFFGLKGAAMATVLGRSLGVVYQLYHLGKGTTVLKICKKHFIFTWSVMKSIANIAWPASIQFMIGSGSWIVLTRMVAEMGGTNASAGYQIAIRNFVFFILPAWGLSNAAATLVGQNLGAKNISRAEESVRTTAKYSAISMLGVTLFFFLFAAPIVSIFTTEAEVFNFAVTALKIIGSGYICYGVGMVMTQALNGAGDTRTPTWINFVCLWLIQLPLAYFLSHHMQLGVIGAVISLPICQGLLALIACYYFKQGSWKKIQV